MSNITESEILESYNQYDYSFQISEHFLTYFLYGDYSGLNDEEIKQIDNFTVNKVFGDYNTIHDTNFTSCEITNLKSQCVEMFFNER